MIDDLYPTAASGDLDVSVREADGSVHQFIQPFSAVPVMQREGQFRYALAAGNIGRQATRIRNRHSCKVPWAMAYRGIQRCMAG
jgi:outer membrane usher protein FimD/PapC